MKKILILGGGFGGVEFYRSLHKKLHGAPHLTFHMISRWNYFLFYPMLHEVATGSVERSHITQPLREIVDCCVEKFTQGDVRKIDFDKREVETDWGSVSYDYLCVSLGVQPNYFNIDGVDQHCVPFKSVQDAVTVRNHVISHIEKATREHDAEKRKRLLSFVIIGGGPTGVELAGQLADLVFHEMCDLYKEIDPSEISITLIDGSDRLLRNMHPELSQRALERLQKMKVTVLLNRQVAYCHEHGVHLANGEEVIAELRVWAAGTRSLMRELVAPDYLTQRGGLKTELTLQLVGHPEVFVIGDNMEIVRPTAVFVPATAQSAAATARHAASNMYAMLQNQPLAPFRFKSLGDIVPIGDWFALAEFGDWRFSGRIAWIIRRFVFLRRIWSPMNRIKIFIDWLLHSLLRRDTSEL